ncbi:MAG TPA: glycosyltransferase family 39 protein [Bryobacteraceae bacterium]|nr:glycosyltransferase family 39 protein [Bryobacteraceae bacterium]
MEPPVQDRKWTWIAFGAVVLYCLLATVLILQRPGLHYDEALLVLGSVQMRHSPTELALPHDPDTWYCFRHRCLPLMTVRYVGAVKDYLCLPLFALFGKRAEVVRFASVFLSLIGIWGVAKIIGEHVSRPAAAFASLAIAINPGFDNITVFDNGTVGVWMAAFGLVCLALSGYARRSRARAAFWLGAAMGFGIWARANFLWLDIAILIAALVVLRKEFLFPLRHWTAWAIGGIAGGLPFLVYQVHSKLGTWEATNMFVAPEPLVDRLLTRLVLFSETLLTDREHRAMWDGPAMPGWQRWLFPAVVVASLVICAVMGGAWERARSLWTRGTVVTFAVLGLFLFLTRTRVSEHHLVALVPLAAIIVVLACSILQARFRWGRGVSGGLAAVYLASVFSWQVQTIEGLHRTRGVGAWSDGVYTLARQLPQKYSAQEIKILDWGLENNLYVLTGARLHTREIYSDEAHAPWLEEIRRGGVFLLNGPENRQFPAATEAFLKALAETRPVVQRFSVPQRSGVPFAEVIDIQSDSMGQGSAQESAREVRRPEKLDGLYEAEPGGFRWTKRQFAVIFGGTGAARLILQLYIPDASIQKLGAVTMTARLGDHDLTPETFRKSGQYTFERDIPAAWMKLERNRFDFTLDKSLAPTAQDARELGIVLVSAALGPK